MNNNQTIGNNVRSVRLAQKPALTQGQFAEAIGVTRITVNAIERGHREPGIGLLSRIATKYGVSLDRLCGLAKNGRRKKRH